MSLISGGRLCCLCASSLVLFEQEGLASSGGGLSKKEERIHCGTKNEERKVGWKDMIWYSRFANDELNMAE